MNKLISSCRSLKQDIKQLFIKNDDVGRESQQKLKDKELNNRVTYSKNGYQPKSHLDNKGNFEKLFTCAPSFDLSNRELLIYQDYQLEYNVAFERENPKHVSFLL